MLKKYTTEEFIEKSKIRHGNKYDYSLVKYFNVETKVNIICEKHGGFLQTPNNHLRGKGCPNCVKNKKTNTFDFIDKAINIHGDIYDYSLVDYKKSSKKIKIRCKIHGIFEQTPNNHLNGRTCLKCALIKKSNKRKSNTNEFIKKAQIIHKNKYDYSLVNYINNSSKVNIICKKHGIFKQPPTNHLSGKGCLLCKKSRGELIVKNYLTEKNINFIQSKSFDGCKNINRLFFDFYLIDHNILIEYDGEQHYKPIKYYGGIIKFENQQKIDKIKTDFAAKNDIKLIRIPYMKINNIKEILNNEIKWQIQQI